MSEFGPEISETLLNTPEAKDLEFDPYNAKESMVRAKSFFVDKGLYIDCNGLVQTHWKTTK